MSRPARYVLFDNDAGSVPLMLVEPTSLRLLNEACKAEHSENSVVHAPMSAGSCTPLFMLRSGVRLTVPESRFDIKNSPSNELSEDTVLGTVPEMELSAYTPSRHALK